MLGVLNIIHIIEWSLTTRLLVVPVLRDNIVRDRNISFLLHNLLDSFQRNSGVLCANGWLFNVSC